METGKGRVEVVQNHLDVDRKSLFFVWDQRDATSKYQETLQGFDDLMQERKKGMGLWKNTGVS